MSLNDIAWSSSPPPEATCPHLPIMRTPQKGKLDFLILSEAMIGCYTHFFGGQTIPCAATGCPACEQNSGRRWKVWLHALLTAERTTIIFETTPRAAEPLQRIMDDGRSLRGCQVIATRVDNRQNAQMHLRVTEVTRGKYILPPSVDVRVALRNIWKIDSTTRFRNDEGYEHRVSELIEREMDSGN